LAFGLVDYDARGEESDNANDNANDETKGDAVVGAIDDGGAVGQSQDAGLDGEAFGIGGDEDSSLPTDEAVDDEGRSADDATDGGSG